MSIGLPNIYEPTAPRKNTAIRPSIVFVSVSRPPFFRWFDIIASSCLRCPDGPIGSPRVHCGGPASDGLAQPCFQPRHVLPQSSITGQDQPRPGHTHSQNDNHFPAHAFSTIRSTHSSTSPRQNPTPATGGKERPAGAIVPLRRGPNPSKPLGSPISGQRCAKERLRNNPAPDVFSRACA